MSFNYLEVEKAVHEIGVLLQKGPATVEDLEWVEFPVLPKRLQRMRLFTDLNLALQLRFDGGELQSLVFSWRAPWVGLYVLPRQNFIPSRDGADFERLWKKQFGGAVSWRDFLVGNKLVSLSQVSKDRIVTLHFSGGEQITVELFPARPNWRVVFATKADADWVTDAESRVLPKTLQWREEKAMANPPSGKGAPTSAPVDVPLAGPGVKDVAGGVINATAGIDNAQRVGLGLRVNVPRPSVLRAFEKGKTWMDGAYFHYLHERRKAFLEQLLTKARTLLDARFAKLLKLRTEMGSSLKQSLKAQEFKQKAESIKAVLHTVSKEAHLKKIAVYTEEGEVDLPLDAKFTVSENVDKLFQQYKKLQRTESEVKGRLETLEQKSKALAHQISELRSFKKQDSEDEIQAAERLMGLFPQVFAADAPGADVGQARQPRKDEKKWSKSGLRSFLSNEGLKIWVGKNHKENEELVIRLARGNDLWFHLKGKPGAHAVIQLPQGKSAALETMLDAAALVAHYSGVSQFDRVDVDYTFRKYVKRVPGQKDKFLVTYTQNKTLAVKPDAARLQRLLGQE